VTGRVRQPDTRLWPWGPRSWTTRNPIWEHVLPREARRGPFEDLDLHRLDPSLPTKTDQLRPLVPGQALLMAFFDIGHVHPPPQARLTDREILGDLCDRLAP